jgi:hypothetical protein
LVLFVRRCLLLGDAVNQANECRLADWVSQKEDLTANLYPCNEKASSAAQWCIVLVPRAQHIEDPLATLLLRERKEPITVRRERSVLLVEGQRSLYLWVLPAAKASKRNVVARNLVTTSVIADVAAL